MEIKQLFAVLLALVVVGSFLPAAFAEDTQPTTTPPAGTPPPPREALIQERAQLRNDMQDARGQTLEQMKQERGQFRNDTNQTRDEFRNNWGNQTNLTKEQREQRQQDFKKMRDGIQDQRKKMLDDFRARREQIQTEFKGQMEQLREQVKQSVEHAKELRDQFKNERENLEKSRENFKNECKNNNTTNSSVCKKAKDDLQHGKKLVLDNAGKQVLEALSVMKTRVQTNPNLEASTSSALLNRLTQSETAVTAAQTKITALTNQSTVNETKAAADELKVAVDDSRVSLKLAHGALVNADFQKFLTHVSTMSEKFKAKSVELKAAGKDTTKLDAAIATFDAKVASVSTTFKQAQDSFVTAMASAKTESDVNAILKAERDQLVAARADAEKAREDLKTIVKELRALDPNAVAAVAKEVSDESKATESTDVDAEVSA